MSKPKKGDFTFVALCMSCKKKRILEDVDGLKLCHECEKKFYNELFKKIEEVEFGKDIVRNDFFKKNDD